MPPHVRVKEVLPSPLRRHLGSLRGRISNATMRPGYTLLCTPFLGELIAAVAPTQRPPILVASLPRSGSSWVGTILGASDNSLYLSEPMNRFHHTRFGEETPSVFDPSTCKDLPSYDRIASQAFRGIPRFGSDVVRDPNRWKVLDRKSKRVVVKEVNPLAIERWWEAFRPSVIFLVRHPVAVIRSRRALGWLEKSETISDKRTGWERGGADQAEVQNLAMSFLRQIDHAVVRYEDLCANPLGEFARIFEYCNLPLSLSVQREIERSANTEGGYAPGRYDTIRNSGQMGERWRSEVDPKDVELVRRGYLAKQPFFYTGAGDW